MNETEDAGDTRPQIDRFKELARALDCGEDEEAFDAALKRVLAAKAIPKHVPRKRRRKWPYR